MLFGAIENSYMASTGLYVRNPLAQSDYDSINSMTEMIAMKDLLWSMEMCLNRYSRIIVLGHHANLDAIKKQVCIFSKTKKWL